MLIYVHGGAASQLFGFCSLFYFTVVGFYITDFVLMSDHDNMSPFFRPLQLFIILSSYKSLTKKNLMGVAIFQYFSATRGYYRGRTSGGTASVSMLLCSIFLIFSAIVAASFYVTESYCLQGKSALKTWHLGATNHPG